MVRVRQAPRAGNGITPVVVQPSTSPAPAPNIWPMAISARADAAAPRARGRGAPGSGAYLTREALQVVVALTVAGAALRFGTLDVQSIWGDEAITIALVHRSFGSMISHLSSSESTPPLYYSLAWVWTRIFGSGALGFRSLSALAGTITIPVVWACGREVSSGSQAGPPRWPPSAPRCTTTRRRRAPTGC